MAIDIFNTQVYLEAMSKPLQEKLRIAQYIPSGKISILDVGCADGVVTSALADLFPEAEILGVDLSDEFINLAKNRTGERHNLNFEKVYLRDLLARDKKYDVITFCSVLHEFFSYGEGISSVVKALADAHELLKPNGRIIIRDMILPDYSYQSNFNLDSILSKVSSKLDPHIIPDFQKHYGEIRSLAQINHLLLKYMYIENWEREVKENYTPLSFDKYQTILNLLGLTIEFTQSYKISYLREKWINDFDLTELEISGLKTTGIILAHKINFPNPQT